MRLIPPSVSVVDADLDKHPLPLRSAPSQTGGSSWETIWCGWARLNCFIPSREPPRNVRLLLIPQKRKKRNSLRFKNLSCDSKRLEIL